MFFRRAKKDPALLNETAIASPAPAAIEADPDETPAVIADQEPSRTGSPALGFKTTDDLKIRPGWLGQEHVLSAIQFALDIDEPDYHACVLAEAGSAAHRAILDLLNANAAKKPMPPDWIYVHNFDDARSPKAIRLPTGSGRILAQSMIEVLAELCTTLPSVLAGAAYKVRQRQCNDAHRGALDAAIAALQQKAAEQNIALLRTPNGFGLAPMHDGKVVKPAVFAQLPADMRSDIEIRITALQTEMTSILEQTPSREREHQKALQALRTAEAQRAADSAFEPVTEHFANEPEALAFLEGAKANLIRNCDVFLCDAFAPGCEPGPECITRDARFQAYLVNVMTVPVAQLNHAPVVAYSQVQPAVGAARANHVEPEKSLLSAVLHSDLHRANGGYLLIEAGSLEDAPEAFRTLKQALATRKIHAGPRSLSAAPIPLDVKAVLLTDDATYQRLCKKDPGFIALFKITARCAERLERTPENEKTFAAWIAELVARDTRLPLTAAAVSALISDSASRAGGNANGANGPGWLSLAEDALTGVLAEAHHGAIQAEDKIIDAGHIQHVFAQRAARLPQPFTKIPDRA